MIVMCSPYVNLPCLDFNFVSVKFMKYSYNAQ